MAYKTIVFAISDKVVADHDIYDENNNLLIKEGAVLTVMGRAFNEEDEDCTLLTFQEIEGEYDEISFSLHPSSIIMDVTDRWLAKVS